MNRYSRAPQPKRHNPFMWVLFLLTFPLIAGIHIMFGILGIMFFGLGLFVYLVPVSKSQQDRKMRILLELSSFLALSYGKHHKKTLSCKTLSILSMRSRSINNQQFIPSFLRKNLANMEKAFLRTDFDLSERHPEYGTGLSFWIEEMPHNDVFALLRAWVKKGKKIPLVSSFYQEHYSEDDCRFIVENAEIEKLSSLRVPDHAAPIWHRVILETVVFSQKENLQKELEGRVYTQANLLRKI